MSDKDTYRNTASPLQNGQDLGLEKDPFDEEDFGTFMKSLVDEGKAYVGAQKNYYTLWSTAIAAKAAGAMLSYVVLAIVLGIVLIFLSVAAAMFVGQLLANVALGFLIVGGVYLLLLLVLWFIWRAGVKSSFTLNILNSLYDGKK